MPQKFIILVCARLKSLYWDKKTETASVKDLKRRQFLLLKKQLNRVYENSVFYRRKFKDAGFHPSDFKEYSDVNKIPFLTREELENEFEGVLSVPYNDIAIIRQTSGTTGRPLTIAHNKHDLGVVAEAYARKLTYHGITRKDVVQVTATYGMWQGAWSIHSGAEKIGAFILPVSSGDTERQIRLLERFGTTVLYGVTNYHFRIPEVAIQLGKDLRNSSLRVGICVGEKPTKQQVAKLKEEMGYEHVVFDYGATEFPGFSLHCREDLNVHHVWSDYHMVESVDPESSMPTLEGERGELIITTLKRDAFPLIRYKSRDVTELWGFEECECGLSHPKIGVDIDRKDFMLKVKGTPVFPHALEHMLDDYEELTGRCQIIVDKRTPKHEAILKLEVKYDLSSFKREQLIDEVRRKIKSVIGITLNEITFVSQDYLGNKVKKGIILE